MTFWKKKKEKYALESVVVIHNCLTVGDFLNKKLTDYSYFKSAQVFYFDDDNDIYLWFWNTGSIDYNIKTNNCEFDGELHNFKYRDELLAKLREKARKLIFPDEV